MLSVAHKQASILEEFRSMRTQVLKTSFPEMKPS
jgi:hypothetical protein